VIGAGAFVQGTLLPLLAKVPGVRLSGVATRSGITARVVADKFAVDAATSDAEALIASSDVDAVLIGTRHDTHADLVSRALKHDKHVFVEKPLAMDAEGLARVIETRGPARSMVLTGFNRRFSPLAQRLRDHVAGKPLVMTYRINAGAIPGASWVQDVGSGGGRIVGEICHFVDTLAFLAGSDVIHVVAQAAPGGERGAADPDNLVVQLTFEDGSVGSILYASTGSPEFAKERLEVFGGGLTGVIDNWRRLDIRGPGVRISERRWLRAAKGHAEEMIAFVRSIRDGVPPISFESQVNTTRATFAIQESLREGRPAAVHGV
jgi:polar amino acid transport system substrate-binding protein